MVDEIHFPGSKPSVHDIIGGAGSYAALGARLFSSSPMSRAVGWIVDCGSDFPKSNQVIIDSWDTSCLLRFNPNRLTTRGWNEYGNNEYRAFKYTTPKLRLEASSCSPELIRSKCFHLICSPSRCIEQVEAILARRRIEDTDLPRPVFVWEPAPDGCSPAELENCFTALRLVDVVSPNHAEIAFFFGSNGEVNGEIDHEAVEKHAKRWLQSGVGSHSQGSVVVRCGKDGCFAANMSNSSWLPAYHSFTNGKVVDPTGGGNAFLGGMGAALARRKDLKEAAIWGSIAASFAIEQIGMPTLEVLPRGELWNGHVVLDRLEFFKSKVN